MNKKLSVTFAPHLQARASIKSLTYTQLTALLPAVLVGLYYYGWRALIIMVLSVLAAVLTEAGMQRMMKREVTVCDGTAALTGLLLAMVLPVGAPWWAVIIGSAVAIILGKQLFGGLGQARSTRSLSAGWCCACPGRTPWNTFTRPRPCLKAGPGCLRWTPRNCPWPCSASATRSASWITTASGIP